jgi:hypothetical protein
LNPTPESPPSSAFPQHWSITTWRAAVPAAGSPMSTPFHGADGASAERTAANERKPPRDLEAASMPGQPVDGNHIKKEWPLEFHNGWNSDTKDVLRIARVDTSFLSYRTQARSCLLRSNLVAIHVAREGSGRRPTSEKQPSKPGSSKIDRMRLRTSYPSAQKPNSLASSDRDRSPSQTRSATHLSSPGKITKNEQP